MPSKTIAFHTFGCKVNQYETEELRTQLKLGGFSVVPMEEAADVYVVNSCTVTADADSSCRQMVRKLLRERPDSRVVVTGCYAERASDELRDMSPKVEVFGNRDKSMIAIALGVPTACVEAAAQSGVTALGERHRAYIKIQDGCDAHCTYCIIPSVRPDLVCRPPQLILKEARGLLGHGYREIVLTGVRLGRYVFGEEWNFSHLVHALLALPGEFRIRLSSIEVTEIPDEVIALAAENPKLCPFFHIPLQSGDDEMLKRMGRWYSSEQYRARIHQIKQAIPDAALSADVIVGFAGEEDRHFANTVRLLQEEGFSRVHAFRYSVRPGTPAEKLSDHVDPRVKSERIRRMVQVDHELRKRYAGRFLNQPLRVLQEAHQGGYTERYVRVRASTALPEGTFQTLCPTELTPEGVLVA